MNPTPFSTKRAGLGRRLLRAGLAAVTCAGVTAGLATGCLNRKVSPAEPNTTNVFVTQITVSAVDKIDLLFVVDNSISMADKQAILREAVPDMLTRLLEPYCEDAEGNLTPNPGTCPEGTAEEFQPVQNLHVGVVSSSLGGHGGIACTPNEGSTWVAEKDDRGELIAPLRGASSFNNLGFLAWDTRPNAVPGATNVLSTLVSDFENIVAATGETGCGYEAQLESFYRFLIDPMPPLEVLNDGRASYVQGINTTLLEQRAQFLRPDSLVAIVVLTDENDCSVRDDGPGFYVAGATAGGKLPRGTQICATDPNNRCCRSCALQEASPPDGCSALSADPSCQLGPFGSTEEHANLRCYEQKRRFGIDFLYPTQRYVDALTNPQVYGRPCAADADCPANPQAPGGGQCVDVGGGNRYCRYTNPLMSENQYYTDLIPRSGSELIYFAGIVGVPWQDIATAETLTDPNNLELIPAVAPPGGGESLQSRWDIILGNDQTGGYPLDPFMWESITPRVGNHAISGLPFPAANPITGDVPLDPASPGAASPINGHEYTVTDGGDLQYACIFRLGQPKECTDAVTGGCDCKGGDSNLATKPLCQDAGQAGTGITQYYAKGYPGLRFLSVLKDFGQNSIVASVCPKITGNPDSPGYGYNPAVRAIINRLKEKLQGTCLPRRLSVNEDGTVACQVVEITNALFNVSCNSTGRTELDPEVKEAVLEEFKRAGRCDNTPTNPCSNYTLCKLQETVGPAREECISLPDQQLSGAGAGYCYIDAMQDRNDDGVPSCRVDPANPGAWQTNDDCIGNPMLVDSCPEAQRRILRFVSTEEVQDKVPYPNSVLFVACQGADLG